MMLKQALKAFIAICITATLGVAVCGCDDLGAYEDVEEYYACFGDIVLISGSTRDESSYSVEGYFYNKESREDFLEGNSGTYGGPEYSEVEYSGVEYGDYVYMAIPIDITLEIDSIALYLQSQSDVTVYMNVFITDYIPENWKGLEDFESESGGTEGETEEETESEAETEEIVFDDPDPETRVGEVVVRLREGEWNSFIVENFNVIVTNEESTGETDETEETEETDETDETHAIEIKESVEICEGQYILIQIRNNSGVRVFDEEKQKYVDPQTNQELQKAEITMTNLLVRALNIEKDTEAEEEEG